MSSTSTADLARFYHERLLPVADALRARGVALLPGTAPADRESDLDAASRSFYEGPPATPELVEIPEGGFGAALEALWREQGLDELAPLAAELERLARELEPEGVESEEVSPFMYVIF
jgi:hypothetical protein